MKNMPICCPVCKEDLNTVNNGFICKNIQCFHHQTKNAYPKVNNIPILISEKKSDTVCSVETGKIYVERPLSRFTNIKELIVGESKITKNNCNKFVSMLLNNSKKPRILVVGGGEKGSGTNELWNNKKLEIDSFDIYASKTTDVVCDAHYMPFKSNSYDGVWIQAVLEHVVEPNKVVAEIYRVLKLKGIVYAETPFMQQVHEGAYDFNRFTVLGHRYLFKNFRLIEMGGNNGPEVVLAWALRYLIWSITRSRKIGRIFGIFFTILLRPFSSIISKKSMFDAASGVYFMGQKERSFTISHKELVSLYKGQF